MLFIEIKSNMKMGKSYKEVRQRGFIFSFCIGFIWGIMMSFAATVPKIKNLLDFILLIVGYLIIGSLFGLFGGVGFSKLLWRTKR